MTANLLIRVTCPSEDSAKTIAHAAIERRLAACANIEGPVSSTYVWKGVIEQDTEHVLWLKTVEPCWEALEALIADLHPYDVPAIVATALTHVYGPYAEWLAGNTKADAA